MSTQKVSIKCMVKGEYKYLTTYRGYDILKNTKIKYFKCYVAFKTGIISNNFGELFDAIDEHLNGGKND